MIIGGGGSGGGNSSGGGSSKVNCTLEQATKAHRKSRYIALLFL